MSFDARFVIIGLMGTALLAWVIFCAIKFILQGRDLILKSGFTVHVKCEKCGTVYETSSDEFAKPGISKSRSVSRTKITGAAFVNRPQYSALMMERLREALATLTPRQASCLHARFWEDKQFKEIAEAEGFTTSAAIVTVRNAIIKLQKYYIKRGWMKPPKEKAICTKTAPPKRNRKKTSAKKS